MFPLKECFEGIDPPVRSTGRIGQFRAQCLNLQRDAGASISGSARPLSIPPLVVTRHNPDLKAQVEQLHVHRTDSALVKAVLSRAPKTFWLRRRRPPIPEKTRSPNRGIKHPVQFNPLTALENKAVCALFKACHENQGALAHRAAARYLIQWSTR